MIKVIARSIFYPWFILFVGIVIGFILNADWSGRKYIMVEKSINNIFFPLNKYNRNLQEYVKCMGALRLRQDHGFPIDFIILEESIMDEEFYCAKIRYTDVKTGQLTEKSETRRIRWRPWEYYYQDEERALLEK